MSHTITVVLQPEPNEAELRAWAMAIVRQAEDHPVTVQAGDLESLTLRLLVAEERLAPECLRFVFPDGSAATFTDEGTPSAWPTGLFGTSVALFRALRAAIRARGRA